MKSKGLTQAKNAEQQRNDTAVFFRLLSEAQQALVQLMSASMGSTAEQPVFRDALEKLQAQIADYLAQNPQQRVPEQAQAVELPVEPEQIEPEQISEPVSVPVAELSQPPDTDPRISQIANRVLRELLTTHPEIILAKEVSEQEIQLFNLLFETDRRKALADLGLNNLSENQIREIEAGEAELVRIQQLQNKKLEQCLITSSGPALWGITQDQITQLNEYPQVNEQRDILADIGLTDISQSQWAKIASENARIQCMQALDHWFFNALFAQFPELKIQTDEEGEISGEVQEAIQAMRAIHERPVLDRNEFQDLLDAIGLQHDWLDLPADLTGVMGLATDLDTPKNWWQYFEEDYLRARAAYYFVDPTLREIIIGDPKYKVQEPIDSAALAIINQAKSTILRGEYLSALRILVPRLILSSDQFEQVTAFFQALEYLKKAVSIDITAKLGAAENTFNNIKKQPITHAAQLRQAEKKIKLVQQALDEIEQSFVSELTQDVVEITFSALETTIDMQNVLSDSALRKFFPLRQNLREYQQEITEIEQQKLLPDGQAIPEPVISKPGLPQSKSKIESQKKLIPENVAAAIQLSRNEKWEGLLEQTEEAVQQVAERFGWEGIEDPKNPDQTIYTYANGLKILYSKKGISYYERNLQDAQMSEDLEQKEKELAYAWVELVRPSILVEPVVCSGNSQAMLSKLVSEFEARHIQTARKKDDKSGGTSAGGKKDKGFFQTLTDAARRLDQFGRYLDKGR
jgi:hypothetical protein